jgi:hypothetical protein
MGNRGTSVKQQHTSACIKLAIRVQPKYYSNTENGYVTIFTEDTKEMIHHPVRFHEDRVTIDVMNVPSVIHSDYRMGAWFYAIEESKSSRYTRRIGACYFTLSDTSIHGKPSTLSITDNSSMSIGTIRIGLLGISPDITVLSGVNESYTTEIKRARETISMDCMTRVNSLYSTTDITEIGNSRFCDVLMAHGQMPIWSFPYLTTEAVKHTPSTHMRVTLESFLNVACYNMGIDQRNHHSLTYAQMSEIIAEMTTLVARGCHYTPDGSRREDRKIEQVDDWSYLCHQPSLSIASYDCEDGSNSVIELSSMLSLTTGITHPILSKIQQHERRYMNMFCICTLRTANTETYNYHVIVVKLDRRWVMRQIEKGGEEEEEKKGEERVPAVLIDSTSYSTGCWEYTSDLCTEDVYETSRSNDPIEVLAKIPSQMHKTRRSMYGHIQLMICPDLLYRSRPICQIDVGRKESDKLGVKVEDMMRYDNTIEFKCYYTNKDTIHAVNTLRRFYLPPIRIPSAIDTQSFLNSIRHPSSYIIDGMVRYIDWNDDTAKEYTHRKLLSTQRLSTQTLYIADGMKVVRVRSPT